MATTKEDTSPEGSRRAPLAPTAVPLRPQGVPPMLLLPLYLLMGVVFIASGLLVNAMQATLYLLLRPRWPQLYRRLNYFLAYSLNAQLVFLVEWWSGSDTVLYAHPDVKANMFGHEHALLLMNHTYEVDWLMGWLIVERCGVLGNAKVYIKKMLRNVPVMGWNWFFGESIYLERDWKKDQETLGPQLKRLVDYPDPIWLLLFAEGTRFTPEKHTLSMEVARSKGLPELKYHLLPRTRGFVASMPFLRGKLPAIYDVIVAVAPEDASRAHLRTMLYGQKPLLAHLMIRRIPLEEVPEDAEGMAQWLHELYRHKDRVLDGFKRTGTFPLDAEHGLEGFRAITIPRRRWSLLNEIFWSAVTLLPICYGLLRLLTSGSPVMVTLAIVILLLALLGLHKMIGLTKISKASSYGSSSPPAEHQKTH